MQVGFVGLGNMGQPIARNLLKAGHQVAVYNRTRSRAEALTADGARVAPTLAEACAPGVVLTMLSDDHALAQCVFNKNGILDSLPAGGLHVSMSTISVKLSQHLAGKHSERGQNYIAAPVFGRPQAAESAQLLVVAAGPSESVERARPLLEPIGRRLFVLGTEASMANALKLSGNFVIASMLEALGEGFALARKHGIEATQALEIVSALFQSPVYENYGRMIADKRFEPAGFKMALGLKDARLVLAAADAAGVPMPLASLVHDQLISGVARGLGEIDWSGIARVVAENAGLGRE
ncbi:MAG TPA: NAD(P)-dependent oxidoreductase [Terriglobia bacterium]|nr:NAD(P)-dependent oxidoreductase [Terriglobia bacterium]